MRQRTQPGRYLGRQCSKQKPTQCRCCKAEACGTVEAQLRPLWLPWNRQGTVGRGKVSLRSSRGSRLCGTSGATVRNLAFVLSKMGDSDGLKQKTHMT